MDFSAFNPTHSNNYYSPDTFQEDLLNDGLLTRGQKIENTFVMGRDPEVVKKRIQHLFNAFPTFVLFLEENERNYFLETKSAKNLMYLLYPSFIRSNRKYRDFNFFSQYLSKMIDKKIKGR